jgi:hypothetical protein
MQIMNRLSGGPMTGDAINTVMSDPHKRKAAAKIIGQAYLTALCCMRHNREGVAQVAEVLVERRELFGNEVSDVLESVNLEAPEIDLLDETIWPKVAV